MKHWTWGFAAAAVLALAAPAGAQVLIAKVSSQSSAGVTNAEYIVLVNHGTSPVNLANWMIRRRIGSNTSNFDMTIAAGTIPARSHFLIASQAYGAGAGAVEGSTADYVDSDSNGLTGSLSNGSAVTLALITPSPVQVDAVSYNGGATAGTLIHEGTAFTGSMSTAPTTNVLRRKRPVVPGLYTDTDNNSSDLEIVAAKANPETSAVNNVPVTVSGFAVD